MTRPVPRFDDNEEFWLEPGAARAVVFAHPPSGTEGDAQLAVYDLTTGDETPIPGAALSITTTTAGSWEIPDAYLEIGPNGDIYWAGFIDGAAGPSMYYATLEGGSAMELGLICSFCALLDISGDGLALYALVSPDLGIYISDKNVIATTRVNHHKYSLWTAAISPVP